MGTKIRPHFYYNSQFGVKSTLQMVFLEYILQGQKQIG